MKLPHIISKFFKDIGTGFFLLFKMKTVLKTVYQHRKCHKESYHVHNIREFDYISTSMYLQLSVLKNYHISIVLTGLSKL